MRVAVDARDLQRHPLRGVGRVVANVLPGLRDAGVDLDLLLDARLPAPRNDVPGRTHRLRAPFTRRRAAWLQVAVPRWLTGRDVGFHTPFYGLPFRQPVPMVVTIHDLAYEHHPEWFPRGRDRVYRIQSRHAARTARRIVTVSRHVADDVIRRYGVPAGRVIVARNGIDPRWLRPRAPEADRSRVRGLGVRGPYLLAIGGTPRRDAATAERVWRALRAGGTSAAMVVLNEAGPEERGLHRVQQPDDDTFAALLAEAALLLYPTRYEGFGLPAVEAAAVGTPVVCARVGALPEVLGDAAAWSHDLTVRSLVDAARSVLDDPPRAAELAELGRARARQLASWEPAIDGHLRAYREAFR